LTPYCVGIQDDKTANSQGKLWYDDKLNEMHCFLLDLAILLTPEQHQCQGILDCFEQNGIWNGEGSSQWMNL
jgi:hypothetical protein